MSIFFTASFIKEGKWYVAHAAEFGVVSQGKTIEEAKRNLQEAVELYLENEPADVKKHLSKQAPLLAVLEAQF